MTTYNLIRSTLAATVCLSVLAACDGRGVTAMKSRSFTAAERAQARLLMKNGSTPDATVKTGGTAASTTGEVDPNITPGDHAQAKEFWEPTDATGKNALIKLAELKNLVFKSGLGTVNKNAQTRVKGITVENVSQPGHPAINLRAVVLLHERYQFLTAENLKIEPFAKDLVSGTSKVALTFKNATVADQAEDPTIDDLLISSVCIEAKDNVCTSVYLMIQFGRDDGQVDIASFELDGTMTIRQTNIGKPWPSFDDGVKSITPDPIAESEAAPETPVNTLPKLGAPAELAVQRLGRPAVTTKTDLWKLSTEKNVKAEPFAPARAMVRPVDFTKTRAAAKPAGTTTATVTPAKVTPAPSVPAPSVVKPLPSLTTQPITAPVDLSNSKATATPAAPAATTVAPAAPAARTDLVPTAPRRVIVAPDSPFNRAMARLSAWWNKPDATEAKKTESK